MTNSDRGDQPLEHSSNDRGDLPHDASEKHGVPLNEEPTNQLQVPATLGDVLNSEKCATDERVLPACSLIAEHLGWTRDILEIPINMLLEKKSTFPRFLEKKLIPRDVRLSHLIGFHIVFRTALRLGWKPNQVLSPQWQSLAQRDTRETPEQNERNLLGARQLRCMPLVWHFARRHLEPAEVTRTEIDEWLDRQVIDREQTFWTAYAMSSRFTTLLIRRGYTEVDPIAVARLEDYGKPISAFESEKLKEEVNKFLSFRKNASDGTDDDEDSWEGEDEEIIDPSLADRRQIRESSARALEGSICRLYGYLHEIGESAAICSLSQLYSLQIFEGYKKWLRSVRLIEPCSLHRFFVRLVSSALQYPPLASNRIWLQNFLAQLPIEKDAIRRKRIAGKTLAYSDLKQIPDKILAERRAIEDLLTSQPLLSERELERLKSTISQMAMREFLVRWILVLPWRARNLCECRIEGSCRNLYKGIVGRYSALAGVPSVRKKIEQDPRRQFWQYKFNKEQCKGNAAIHRLLPNELIDPLETYLEKFRGTSKSETIFVDAEGKQLSTQALYCILCELTLQHGKKRLSPKVFRDVYAFEYMRTQEGYSVLRRLSFLLWHKHTITTRRYYATQYNFSALTECVESYLAGRRPKRTLVSYAPLAPVVGFVGTLVVFCMVKTYLIVFPILSQLIWQRVLRR